MALPGLGNAGAGASSIVTPIGSFAWASGTHAFVVPPDVYSVSIVAIGGGGGGVYSTSGGSGGSGGDLRWIEHTPVIPGETLDVIVGGGGAKGTITGTAGGESYVARSGTRLISAAGGAGGTITTTSGTQNGTSTGRTAIHWTFNPDAQGWTAQNGTISIVGTAPTSALRITPTATDVILRSPGLSLLGSSFYRITVRLKRSDNTSTQDPNWNGAIFGSNAGHGESGSFYKVITQPTWQGSSYVDAVWDMSSLTVGGTDWITNTTTAFRLDLTDGNLVAYDIEHIIIDNPLTVSISGGTGGTGGASAGTTSAGGGGGAGGYTSAGGDGSSGASNGIAGSAGAGGGAAGGPSGGSAGYAAGGGGVSYIGEGPSGTATSGDQQGNGGSYGTGGGADAVDGGFYGGGGAGADTATAANAGNGNTGVVRIMYGDGRKYPDFNENVFKGSMFRWNITAVRTAGNLVQASEFKFYYNNVFVNWPVGTTITSPNTFQGAEPATNLIDGNNSSKACTTTNNTVIFYITTPTDITINQYAYVTANDTIGRDPVSWTLDVSYDGGITWTPMTVAVGFAALITTLRNTETTLFGLGA